MSTTEKAGVCRVCGCTDDRACPGGCHWVEPDLCSSCEGYVPVPWEAAKSLADEHGKDQVIILAWDRHHGHVFHTATYGRTPIDAQEAAEGGNRLARILSLGQSQVPPMPAQTQALWAGLHGEAEQMHALLELMTADVREQLLQQIETLRETAMACKATLGHITVPPPKLKKDWPGHLVRITEPVPVTHNTIKAGSIGTFLKALPAKQTLHSHLRIGGPGKARWFDLEFLCQDCGCRLRGYVPEQWLQEGKLEFVAKVN